MNLFSPFSAVAACLTSWQKPDRAPAHKVSLSRLYPYSLLLPLAVLLLGSVTGIANAQSSNKLFDNPEPLHPQEAFIPEVTRVTAETIHVEFTIADGYYLYRDKSKFTLKLPNGDALDSAIVDTRYSAATTIDDEFFGTSAIFRDNATAELTHQINASARTLDLVVTFQGCADFGLCYPPTDTQLTVELPTDKAGTQYNASADELSQPLKKVNTNTLQDLFGSSNDQGSDLLHPSEAFIPLIMSTQADEINLQWQIEPGYYLYRDKLSFSLSDAGDASIVGSNIDEGVFQYDEFFGNVAVLRDIANATLSVGPPVSATSTQSKSLNALLSIKYQGCADIGVCFPPETFEIPVVFDQLSASVVGQSLSNATIDTSGNSASNSGISTVSNSGRNSASNSASSVSPPAQSEQDRITGLLASKGIWLVIATFLGLGLLLSLTPCVLPMFPILSSLIVGQGDSLTTGKAFRLSLVYVLVMAFTYAIVGVLVGLSGYNIQIALQNPWVLSTIALIFVLLSLSMFGLYELQLPVSWQQKLTSWSNSQRGGDYGGVAIMGFISTLIVGPCVTAPLAGALLFIANTGNAFTGGIALFALGIGMGLPLLLVGTSAGTLVPKAGLWMDKVKYIFGFLMLGMAIWMMSRLLPSEVTIGLFGILAVMCAIYLGATDSLNSESSSWQRLGKGSGIVVGLYGLALCFSALSGTGSYTSPLRGLIGGASIQNAADHAGLQFVQIKGTEELEASVANAMADGKSVMLDFYADWCVSCKEMEAFTFTDDRVQTLLKDTVLIQADVTKNDVKDKALLKKFKLFGPPGIIFYDVQGQELPAARVVGFMSANKFSAHIESFLGSSLASR